MQLFPDLDKIVLLDDDVVVQRDLSSLWETDLNGNVVGAVVDSWCGSNCCPGRKYKDYFNFSHPLISSNLLQDECAWLSGMNVFDLKAWRQTNITEAYSTWLRLVSILISSLYFLQLHKSDSNFNFNFNFNIILILILKHNYNFIYNYVKKNLIPFSRRVLAPGYNYGNQEPYHRVYLLSKDSHSLWTQHGT